MMSLRAAGPVSCCCARRPPASPNSMNERALKKIRGRIFMVCLLGNDARMRVVSSRPGVLYAPSVANLLSQHPVLSFPALVAHIRNFLTPQLPDGRLTERPARERLASCAFTHAPEINRPMS